MTGTWQAELAAAVRRRLGPRADVAVTGSALRPETLDGWSDLDLHLRLAVDVDLAELVDPAAVWTHDVATSPEEQVVRLVLRDGRRLDLQVRGPGRLHVPAPDEPGRARFLAAVVAAKTGRRDLLIATHLLLELLRTALVLQMVRRDRDTGTTVHRTGTAHDDVAAEVAAAAALPLPQALRATCVLLDRGWSALEPGHVPDWGGLDALLARGAAEA